MNRLKGKISAMQSSGELSLVKGNFHGSELKSIVLENEKSAPWLKPGTEVEFLFKETEVAIAKNSDGRISLQNRLPVQLMAMEKGELLSSLRLDFNGIVLQSVITTAATEQLQLKTGDQLEALIKTNEIMIAPLQ